MTLRDLMALHARTILTRPEHFGEEVLYWAKDADLGRAVRAVVDRLDVEPAAPGVRQVAKLRAIVAIPRDELLGTTAVVPGDRVEMAMRLGEAAQMTRVTRIVSQDEGMFVVEVTA